MFAVLYCDLYMYTAGRLTLLHSAVRAEGDELGAGSGSSFVERGEELAGSRSLVEVDGRTVALLIATMVAAGDVLVSRTGAQSCAIVASRQDFQLEALWR